MKKLLIVAALVSACDGGGGGGAIPQPSGLVETVFTVPEDGDNAFFRALGSNQRTCASCHDREAGWSISPASVSAVFEASEGTDPLFRPIDGATSPDADVSTVEARRAAYALLLERALIRVERPVPAGAEFSVTAVDDPYGHASAAGLSLFRRPLPSTNLRFHSQIMWDGREPSLRQQALDATMGHAQATMGVAPEVIDEIVAFESGTYTAQREDDIAGDLGAEGAQGGAQALVVLPMAAGGGETFGLFGAWTDADTSTPQGARRASIARGERIFNTERFRIRGVAGLADQQGTCSTCHDVRGIGSHSLPEALDIGVSDADRRLDTLPLYTFRRTSDGREVQSTDPGEALTSGRWEDIGKFKVPALRGLAMRPPYFHNGMADDLGEVVEFYVDRFGMRLSGQERSDLVAFLGAL